MPITYQDAGVDIEKGDSLVERIKPFAAATRTAEVLDGIGGFAGLCGLPAGVDDPVLVSGTDGVGTKLKLAFQLGRHDTIGQDLVAMCVNDVVTVGAAPLFFLDYFACGKLDVDVAEQVIRGIADGCKLAGCALLGGETAELPGMYADGEYDLAGFSVGVVSKRAILGPPRVREGDALIAVASSGLHSNGFSLARKVIQGELRLNLKDKPEGFAQRLGDELLTPTRIYARAVAALKAALGEGLHALCHVTGGGIVGNLPRVLPKNLAAQVALPRRLPAIFELIQSGGPVSPEEMLKTFNLGVGLVVVTDPGQADAALNALQEAGERSWQFGQVAAAAAGDGARVRVDWQEG